MALGTAQHGAKGMAACTKPILQPLEITVPVIDVDILFYGTRFPAMLG